MKKKVLLVVTQGNWGGAQKYVFDLASELKARDCEVAVAVGEPNGERDLQEKLRAKNIEVFQLKNLVRPISPLNDASAIFELAGLYKKFQSDVVHLNSSKAGVLGALAKFLLEKKQRPKIVYTVHGWAFLEPVTVLVKAIYFWAEKLSAAWKDKVIVLSGKELKIAQEKLGIKNDKLVKISHGLKLDQMLFPREEAREKLNLPANGQLVGAVAGFYATKGLDILLLAMKKISPKASLVLIGDGPEKNRLEEMIKDLDLGQRVFLPGQINDAYRYFTAFDLLALSSRKEGFPYVILEAGLAGIPVAATDVGGVGEIIDNRKTGLLVPAENADKLAEAINELLSDGEQAQKMSAALKEKIRNERSFTEMIEATMKVYLD